VIQPNDFLALADTLAQGASEAEWRTAISRAYYSAFLEARGLLVDMRFQVPRGAQAHGYLYLRLSNAGDAAVVMAGNALHDLQGERNRADYEPQRTFTQADALAAVVAARTIMTALAAARVEPLRTQVRDAMRDYERNVLKAVTYQGP
jgi:uncharacterized protein (UPF0332 family)